MKRDFQHDVENKVPCARTRGEIPNSARRNLRTPTHPSFQRCSRSGISSAVHRIAPRACTRGEIPNRARRSPRSRARPSLPRCIRASIINKMSKTTSRVRSRSGISNIMHRIVPRACTRGDFLCNMLIIAPRVHLLRFSHVCDLGFCGRLYRIASRARTRSEISNIVYRIAPRERARGGISNTMLETIPRVCTRGAISNMAPRESAHEA